MHARHALPPLEPRPKLSPSVQTSSPLLKKRSLGPVTGRDRVLDNSLSCSIEVFFLARDAQTFHKGNLLAMQSYYPEDPRQAKASTGDLSSLCSC